MRAFAVQKLFIAGILLLSMGYANAARAENGQAQATMSLIVPPTPQNMAAIAPLHPSATSQPAYNRNADKSVIHYERGNRHQVWFTL